MPYRALIPEKEDDLVGVACGSAVLEYVEIAATLIVEGPSIPGVVVEGAGCAVER